MTKKKYRQQSDTTPLSESASSSSSSVPVSHSDDEGNVVIDTATDASAPIYEPIPEVVELESSSLPSPSSVQDPGPVAELPESSEIDLVPAPVQVLAPVPVLAPLQVLALERVLEPVPEPIAPSQALVADPNADAVVGVSEPLSVLVLDSSSTTNTTSTSSSIPNTTSTSKWIQFKSWFSKCCRACCCCCCHRRRNRDVSVTSS